MTAPDLLGKQPCTFPVLTIACRKKKAEHTVVHCLLHSFAGIGGKISGKPGAGHV
jgi:hypothetical protein